MIKWTKMLLERFKNKKNVITQEKVTSLFLDPISRSLGPSGLASNRENKRSDVHVYLSFWD